MWKVELVILIAQHLCDPDSLHPGPYPGPHAPAPGSEPITSLYMASCFFCFIPFEKSKEGCTQLALNVCILMYASSVYPITLKWPIDNNQEGCLL